MRIGTCGFGADQGNAGSKSKNAAGREVVSGATGEGRRYRPAVFPQVYITTQKPMIRRFATLVPLTVNWPHGRKKGFSFNLNRPGKI